MKKIILMLVVLSLASLYILRAAERSNGERSHGERSHGERHGEVYIDAVGDYSAWDANLNEWLSIEDFWENYAQQRGGLTWGETTEYPPYTKLKELDTMIIILDSGPCLMEFWHSRWRRANDVRRWDTKFNDYGGCPDVFK